MNFFFLFVHPTGLPVDSAAQSLEEAELKVRISINSTISFYFLNCLLVSVLLV